MEGLPDKLTFNVEEVARLLGIGRSKAYELVRTGTLPSIDLGYRKLIGRHALVEFLGLPPDEREARAAKGAAAKGKDEDEQDEWTYVITVKRLKRGERARIEPDRYRQMP